MLICCSYKQKVKAERVQFQEGISLCIGEAPTSHKTSVL